MWVMSNFVYMTRPLHFSTFFCIFVAMHMTVHGLRVTRLNEYTKIQSYSHESIPVAMKSVPIRIKTQMRGFTEDKAVIFPGDTAIL